MNLLNELNIVFKAIIISFVIQFILFFLSLNGINFFSNSFFSLINALIFIPLIYANLKLIIFNFF